MKGYTKLFSSIVSSSIWQEPDETRIVWITLLALADMNGKVDAALPGLANIANVSLEKTAKAIKRLESPDRYSRSREFEGRRIQPCDGGWLVLNHAKYRAMLNRNDPDRREYQRVKQAQYRAARRANKTVGGPTTGEISAMNALNRGDEETFERIAAERP